MTTGQQLVPSTAEQRRSDSLYCQAERENHQAIDRMFVVLMLVQWVAAMLLTLPHVWIGGHWELQLHVCLALLLGSIITAFPVYMAIRHSGLPETRNVIAIAQICFSCLLIHICGGRAETHFHIFASLAILAAYRDWRIIINASLVVVADHFIRGTFWPQSVFGVADTSSWRWVEHTLWIAFEDVFLITGCIRGRREMFQAACRTARLEASLEDSETQTNKLRREQVLRDSLIEHAPEVIVTMDTGGRITGWNRQAQAMFGWSVSEATGASCESLFIPRKEASDHHHCFAWMGHRRESRLHERIETTVWNRNREAVLIEITFSEFSTESDPQYCAFIRNISDRKQHEEEVESARVAAEANSQAKTRFLTNMSHELRTPLTAILGFTHVLRFEPEDSPEMSRDEVLDAIESSGKNLLELLNDLFDLTRIESGQIAIIRDHCDPDAIISEVFESFQTPASAKGLELNFNWSSQQPTSIRTDPLRLGQILNNLLSNAVKFTESGGIELEARIEKSGWQPAQLIITVRDTGIGISNDYLERIFLPFEQVDGSLTRRKGGTGLGLAVSRRLAHELNGNLTVESRIGYGTVFTLTVEAGNALFGQVDSLTDAENGDRITGSAGSRIDSDYTKPDLTGLRVLLCEDKRENSKLLEFLITSAGGDVAVAVNGRDGVALALEHPFDIIIMDMQMPVMDGYTAARKLRSEGVEVPIVALTAHTMNRAEERSLEAGCTHFVAKPFNPRQLLGQLKEFTAQSLACETP